MEIITLIYIGFALIAGFLIGKVLFNKQLQDKIAALDAKERELADVQSKLSSTQDELQGKIAALDAKERELADVQSKLSSMQGELQGKSVALEEKECELADVQSKLSSMQVELQGKIAALDAKERELADVQSKLSSTQDELQGKSAALEDKEHKLADVQGDLAHVQDELKDVQEELSDAKSDLKAKKSELRDANNELSKVSNEKEQLIKISDDLEKKDSLKSKTLDFVKGILTATTDSSNDDRYTHIDNIYSFIKEDVKNAVCACGYFNGNEDEFFGSGLERWAASAKKSWISGKTSVAFVGEFSAGKTSIVNRILSANNPDFIQLPVSTEATTAIPTYISGGVETMYRFVSPSNELKHISSSIFEQVNKDVLSQIKGVSSLIKYFVMLSNNPNLRNLSILDTPGFSSTDREDAERTISVINECDALFWVIDVNAGTINKTSIEIIKQHLRKPLYIVINKVDTKSPSEVDKVVSYIRDSLKNEGIPVNGFIRFSIKSPLDNMMKPINSIAHDKLKDEYIDTLLKTIDDCVNNQFSNRKSALESLLGSNIKNNFINCIYQPLFTSYISILRCYHNEEDDDDDEIITTSSSLANIVIEELEGIIDDFWNKRSSDNTSEIYSRESTKYLQLVNCSNKLKKMIECVKLR